MSCIGLPADEMPGANNGREGESAVPLADAHATFESSMTSRFLADAMLGGLVRWLRALGFDTAYDPAIHDPELVALADAQARMLLTRDRHLLIHLHPARGLLITDDAPLGQLREVITACNLARPAELFTRCLVCNAPLRPATASEIVNLVPDGAQSLPGPVRRCSGCERVYWPGSHVRRMRQTLAKALPDWDCWD